MSDKTKKKKVDVRWIRFRTPESIHSYTYSFYLTLLIRIEIRDVILIIAWTTYIFAEIHIGTELFFSSFDSFKSGSNWAQANVSLSLDFLSVHFFRSCCDWLLFKLYRQAAFFLQKKNMPFSRHFDEDSKNATI